MASAEDPTTVFGEEDLDDDEDEDSEEEEENLALPSHQDDDVLDEDDEDDEDDDVLDEASASPSTSGDPHISSSSVAPVVTVPVVTVAVPGVPNGEPIPAAVDSASDPKRPRAGEEKKPFDESRRLFQRLWTDEDEIELLQGFLEYSAQRGPNSSSHHHDTTAFYDQIKSKLQLDFNKNQLVEKLRRLKKKYRNVVSRISSGKEFSFKSPHDQSTFEISRKIWSTTTAITGVPEETVLEDDDANPNPNPTTNPSPNPNPTPKGFNSYSIDVNSAEKKVPRSRKRSRAKLDEKPVLNNQNHEMPSSIPSLIEETVRSCLSPLFKELLHNAVNGPSCGARGFGGMALNPMPLSFGGTEVTDERWRKQQILELEVYSKRLELVQEQIRSALQELRGMGSWWGWFGFGWY